MERPAQAGLLLRPARGSTSASAQRLHVPLGGLCLVMRALGLCGATHHEK